MGSNPGSLISRFSYNRFFVYHVRVLAAAVAAVAAVAAAADAAGAADAAAFRFFSAGRNKDRTAVRCSRPGLLARGDGDLGVLARVAETSGFEATESFEEGSRTADVVVNDDDVDIGL